MHETRIAVLDRGGQGNPVIGGMSRVSRTYLVPSKASDVSKPEALLFALHCFGFYIYIQYAV